MPNRTQPFDLYPTVLSPSKQSVTSTKHFPVRSIVLALRLSLATSLLATGIGPLPAMAESDVSNLAPATSTTQQHFNITPGPLVQVLTEFSGVAEIYFVGASSLAADKTSAGVSGNHTIQTALIEILSGTGLQAERNNQGRYVLRRAPEQIALPTLAVMGRLYGAKETTSLADSSASVGIIDEKAIDYGQISYLPQAMRRLANVEKGATNNTGLVVRGMNFEGFSPAGAPMGSIYVDGILQSRYNSRFGARNLWDVEQVELYRGPQTTLSGRAATAGAIYLKTKDPTFDKSVSLSATTGNKDLKGGGFVVNTPLSEKHGIAFRVSGIYEENETEVRYPSYGDFANYDDFRTELSGAFRAKLLIEPDTLPDTRIMLTYGYSKDRPNERLVGPDINDRGDFYQFSTFAEYREIDVHNTGLEVTHALSPSLTLTSQTGLSHGTTDRESIDNGTRNLVNAFYGTYDDTLLSQEIRLNYEQDEWRWVAGIFGSYEDQDSAFFARLTEWGIEQEQFYDRKTTNLAIFGEATYQFMPAWKVTFGGRLDYLKEKTDETDILAFIGAGASSSVNSADISEVNFVPKVGISREFGEDHIAGFTFSRGFRTGGFYVETSTGKAETYDPEYANNYEFYYKGLFLDQRLRLNANVFYTEYKDQQVETYPDPSTPTGTIVSNAASSYVIGFELEPSFQVNEALSVFASLGYLHTEFQDFNHSIYGDLSGERFPEASEWSVAFGGLYEFNNGFYVSSDAKYLSAYNSRFSTNPPLDKMSSRFLVNLQAGIRRDNWQVNLFAENLFDKHYYTMTELQGSPVFGQVGPSRLVGINVKINF
ncbi:TonB-dependent receptor [Methylophaga frappieri]|uniref:TonB-dependent receptor n=1 Tax=Methylophaga frappieri (strain ATCC BAA-2434 / DSM 25690 / JAM7) TaxID=754477 RepID=I1YEM6_METFJ|nr:TonB-dependent receptor [Methylophaga frappieri]AFJ01369.1 TonB-dependent receptor [Methylophaga frappieri]